MSYTRLAVIILGIDVALIAESAGSSTLWLILAIAAAVLAFIDGRVPLP